MIFQNQKFAENRARRRTSEGGSVAGRTLLGGWGRPVRSASVGRVHHGGKCSAAAAGAGGSVQIRRGRCAFPAGRGIWQGKKPIAFERDFSAVQQKIFFPAGGGRSRTSMRSHGWPWRGRCWFAYAPALLGLGWAVARARVPGALQDRRGNCVYYAGCFGG